MKKFLLIVLIAMCYCSTQTTAQNIQNSYGAQDDKLATAENIYEYLKNAGYNPVEEALKKHNSVVFYSKLSRGLIFIGVNYTSGFISIGQAVVETNEVTGSLKTVDFRTMGVGTGYILANAIMTMTEMVQALYDKDSGALTFEIELPIMNMTEFKSYFGKCLNCIVSANDFLDRILNKAADNTSK